MKAALEDAIISCNCILRKWKSAKPALIDVTNINALFLHYLSKVIRHRLNWRESKRLFTGNSLVVDINIENMFIKDVYFLAGGRHEDSKVIDIKKQLAAMDYEELYKRSLSQAPPTQITELSNFSLDTLENIKF